MYLIKQCSVGIMSQRFLRHSIFASKFKIHRKSSYSDDHVGVVLLIRTYNTTHDIPHTYAKFHLTTPVKEFNILQYYTVEKIIHEDMFYAA